MHICLCIAYFCLKYCLVIDIFKVILNYCEVWRDPWINSFSWTQTGPAPDAVTNKIYEISKNIVEYRICPELKCDISKIGTNEFSVSINHVSIVNEKKISVFIKSACIRHEMSWVA